MTTISAELSIYGEMIEPNQVTEKLGIHPCKTWRRGDIKNRRTNATYDYACWKILTDENGLPLESHVRILMDWVSECRVLIHPFALENGCEVEVSAIVKLDEESPDISLSKEIVNWMSEIGAAFDVDIYL